MYKYFFVFTCRHKKNLYLPIRTGSGPKRPDQRYCPQIYCPVSRVAKDGIFPSIKELIYSAVAGAEKKIP
jgi:hypothetical protein